MTQCCGVTAVGFSQSIMSTREGQRGSHVVVNDQSQSTSTSAATKQNKHGKTKKTWQWQTSPGMWMVPHTAAGGVVHSTSTYVLRFLVHVRCQQSKGHTLCGQKGCGPRAQQPCSVWEQPQVGVVHWRRVWCMEESKSVHTHTTTSCVHVQGCYSTHNWLVAHCNRYTCIYVVVGTP